MTRAPPSGPLVNRGAVRQGLRLHRARRCRGFEAGHRRRPAEKSRRQGVFPGADGVYRRPPTTARSGARKFSARWSACGPSTAMQPALRPPTTAISAWWRRSSRAIAARGKTVADQLEVGVVWVNAPQVIFPQTSWGGFKLSGIGRELGPWGLQSFQEIKHVVTARSVIRPGTGWTSPFSASEPCQARFARIFARPAPVLRRT